MNKGIKIIKYCLPSIVTGLVFCVILAIKQIYPFGKFSIDYYDMAQQIAAFYYHVYDVLHGSKSLFFDWYTGLTVNMSMSTSGCSNLSVFNLFFLFVPRDAVLHSLSLFQMIKMMTMAFTMYVYLHNVHRLNYFYEVIYSIGYSFCGYVLLLYITNQWMDIAALFPIIVLFARKTVKDGKNKGYIFFLDMSMISSYYITFMILVYLFLAVGWIYVLDVIFNKRKSESNNEIKYHLSSFCFSSFAAIMLSSFILIPQIKQTIESARFGNENSGNIISLYFRILSNVDGVYITRFFSLMGISLPAAFIGYGLIKLKMSKKECFAIGGAILLVVSELLFENINLIWHFGSYVQYPIRNGFMIYFTFVELAAYINEKDINLAGIDLHVKHFVLKLLVPFGFASIILIRGIWLYNANSGISVTKFAFYVMLVILALFLLYLVFVISNKRSLRICILPVFICEVLFWGYVMFGQPAFITGYSEEKEQEGEYIRIANQIKSELDIDADYTERIKNPDTSMNANYGLVLERGTLSNWTHLIRKDLQKGAADWGYSIQFTRLLDAGGTVFSDAALGIKNVITCIEQPSELYELLDHAEVIINHKTGEVKNYYYYKCKYELPFAMTVNDLNYSENIDIVETHNYFYKSLCKDDNNIAEWIYRDSNYDKVRPYLKELQNNGTGNVVGEIQDTIKVNGRKALYFVADGVDSDYYNYMIRVNGKIVPIPSIGESNNIFYPAHFNNNVVLIGCYENEDIDLDLNIVFDERKDDYNYNVFSIDIDMLKELCDSCQNDNLDISTRKNGIDVTLDDNIAPAFIVPISFDNGFDVCVNGENVDAKTYMGLFTLIPLHQGRNSVSISFFPSGMKLGIMISVTTCAFLGVLLFLKKKYEKYYNRIIKRMDCLLSDFYIWGFCFMVSMMYIIPIAFGLYHYINKIFTGIIF